MTENRDYDLQPLVGGGYAAIREQEPLFCFVREDAAGARAAADDALRAYRDLAGRPAAPLPGAPRTAPIRPRPLA